MGSPIISYKNCTVLLKDVISDEVISKLACISPGIVDIALAVSQNYGFCLCRENSLPKFLGSDPIPGSPDSQHAACQESTGQHQP